jgi:dihydroxy-acid dehydratase
MLPLPDKILKLGIRDMVRISDARMSGTSYGTCVLHVAPESHIGGPLALVQDGDLIELDVESRSLNLLVAPQTLEDRRKAWKKPVVRWQRGYLKMFSEHTTQANQGCDFDFLHGNDADLEPEI